MRARAGGGRVEKAGAAAPGPHTGSARSDPVCGQFCLDIISYMIERHRSRYMCLTVNLVFILGADCCSVTSQSRVRCVSLCFYFFLFIFWVFVGSSTSSLRCAMAPRAWPMHRCTPRAAAGRPRADPRAPAPSPTARGRARPACASARRAAHAAAARGVRETSARETDSGR